MVTTFTAVPVCVNEPASVSVVAVAFAFPTNKEPPRSTELLSVLPVPATNRELPSAMISAPVPTGPLTTTPLVRVLLAPNKTPPLSTLSPPEKRFAPLSCRSPPPSSVRVPVLITAEMLSVGRVVVTVVPATRTGLTVRVWAALRKSREPESSVVLLGFELVAVMPPVSERVAALSVGALMPPLLLRTKPVSVFVPARVTVDWPLTVSCCELRTPPAFCVNVPLLMVIPPVPSEPVRVKLAAAMGSPFRTVPPV